MATGDSIAANTLCRYSGGRHSTRCKSHVSHVPSAPSFAPWRSSDCGGRLAAAGGGSIGSGAGVGAAANAAEADDSDDDGLFFCNSAEIRERQEPILSMAK